MNLSVARGRAGLVFGLLHLDGSLHPLGVVGHLGVYPVLALPTAALPEGGDAVDGPPVVFLTEERPARVPGTAVNPAAPVAGTEHVVCDVVVLVDTHAVLHPNYRNLTYKQQYYSQ